MANFLLYNARDYVTFGAIFWGVILQLGSRLRSCHNVDMPQAPDRLFSCFLAHGSCSKFCKYQAH